MDLDDVSLPGDDPIGVSFEEAAAEAVAVHAISHALAVAAAGALIERASRVESDSTGEAP